MRRNTWNFHENNENTKKNEPLKVKKVYFIEIRAIQNVFIYKKIIFLSHSPIERGICYRIRALVMYNFLVACTHNISDPLTVLGTSLNFNYRVSDSIIVRIARVPKSNSFIMIKYDGGSVTEFYLPEPRWYFV